MIWNYLKKFFSSKFWASLVNFFKYGIVLCIIPPLLNYAALNRETPLLGSHGLPYDIGLGQKLFLSCKGNGLPTILMESPLGVNSDIWLPLQEKLATVTKVCVYDRAGLGLSERPNEPAVNKSEKIPRAKIQRGQEFTIERMAEDLRRLVTSSSQQDRPLMLVGAEFGSMIARFYAQIYQDEISHLVLINPLVEGLFKMDDSVWNEFWYKKILPKWQSYAIGSAIGLNRLLLMANFISPQIKTSKVSDEIQGRQKFLMCNPKHLFSVVDEYVNLNETMAQMRLIWTIKQFAQNISVSIVRSSADDQMFAVSDHFTDDKNLKEKLNNAWSKSVEILKTNLHPNAHFHSVDESLYRQLYEKPEYLFRLIEDLILNWRRKNPVVKNI